MLPDINQITINSETFVEYHYSDSGILIYNPNGSARPLVLYGIFADVFNAIKVGGDLPQNISEEECFKILQLFNSEKIITCDAIDFSDADGIKQELGTHKSSIGLWVHTTNACNLQCSYCYVKKGSDKLTKEVAKRLVDAIKKDVQIYGLKIVRLKFAGGEPLLALPVIEFLAQHITQELATYVKINLSIITNGTLLTLKNILILKELGIKITVSLDGIGDYNSARIYKHGGSSYNNVISKIELLLSQNIKPTILTVLSNYNLAGIGTLIDFVVLHELNMGLNFSRECTPNNQKVAIDIRKIKKYLIPQLERLINMDSKILPRIHFGGITFAGRKKRICGAGTNYFAIGTQGEISSCQMNLNNPITQHIPQNGLRSLGAFYKMRTQSTKCSDCIWRYVCCGGCDFLAEQKGSLNTPHVFCEIYKEVLPYILKLEGRYTHPFQ